MPSSEWECDFIYTFPEDEHSEQFQTNKLQFILKIKCSLFQEDPKVIPGFASFLQD